MLKYFWLINIFFVVTGCSFFGKERIKPSSLLPFEETVFIEKVWAFDNKTQLDEGDISLETAPSVLGEKVIIPSRNGVVTILKLATGQIEERIEHDQSIGRIGQDCTNLRTHIHIHTSRPIRAQDLQIHWHVCTSESDSRQFKIQQIIKIQL